MATKRFPKMRILRMCVKFRSALLSIVGLIILFFIGFGAYHFTTWAYSGLKQCYHVYIADDMYGLYNSSKQINKNFRFCENGSKGFIENVWTRKKVLKDVYWISGLDNEGDTLLCYASNGFRGFLNKNTCQVQIPADRYKKAWLFSEGVAAVMEKDSVIKFVNPKGEIVLNTKIKYAELPDCRGYLFKNGQCPMKASNGYWGLINKKGQWTVRPVYDDIFITSNNFWVFSRQGRQGVLNDSLQIVLQPQYREVLVTESGIEILKDDYNRQLLDYKGNVLSERIYTDIIDLSFKKKENDFGEGEYELSPYKAYQTVSCSSTTPTRVGLMSPDGNPVTPPVYERIEAVNAQLFRCYYYCNSYHCDNGGASVLINSKGQIVR